MGLIVSKRHGHGVVGALRARARLLFFSVAVSRCCSSGVERVRIGNEPESGRADGGAAAASRLVEGIWRYGGANPREPAPVTVCRAHALSTLVLARGAVIALQHQDLPKNDRYEGRPFIRIECTYRRGGATRDFWPKLQRCDALGL